MADSSKTETGPVVVPSTNDSKSGPWGKTSAGVSGAPWGMTTTHSTCSLEEVMGEELAMQLQKEEQTAVTSHLENAPDFDMSQFMIKETGDDTSNDFELARQLQYEFDKEQDQILKLKEDKFNGESKVRMCYDKYRIADPDLDVDSPHEEDDDGCSGSDEEKEPAFNKRGIRGKGKNITTKHDPAICGRKNARNMVDQLDVPCGDSRKVYDMRLPNHVYNKLKMHSQSESKRSARLHEKKEHSTVEQAMDPRTKLMLYRLVNAGILECVNGVISSGKESSVYHADGGQDTEFVVPMECAVKVFKTTLTDFRNRSMYVKGDVRFFKDEFKHQNPRKIMKIWANKEEYNLKRLEKACIPCPRVVIRKHHVLVMTFIGQDSKAAPKLKDANLSLPDLEIAYDQCVIYLKKMYQEAKIIHADLSEYNMLWHSDSLYLIDVSQAVDIMHPLAHEFLLRDCRNVCDFFTKAGLRDVPTQYKLFNDITQLNLQGEGATFLAQIQEYEKSEERLRMGTGKDYSFDYFFDRATKQRTSSNQGQFQIYSSSSEEEEVDEDLDEEGVKIPEGNFKYKSVAKSPNSRKSRDSKASRSPKSS